MLKTLIEAKVIMAANDNTENNTETCCDQHAIQRAHYQAALQSAQREIARIKQGILKPRRGPTPKDARRHLYDGAAHQLIGLGYAQFKDRYHPMCSGIVKVIRQAFPDE
eukprot:259644_1